MVSNVFAVIADRVLHGRPRDKEEDKGAVATVHHAAKEDFLAEVHVTLARSVELRIL